MLEFLKNKRILIVAAHPDDELLGLGATMNRLVMNYGVTAHVVILSQGLTSRFDGTSADKGRNQLEIHLKNIHDAQKTIGYHSVSVHELPDNCFDTVALLDIVKIVEKEKDIFEPDVIFTHHGGDLNIDHQRTFEAVITACRPMPSESVKTIITFETPSCTEWQVSTGSKQFNPNFFVEVSEENIAAKIKGMEIYEFEKRAYPHPRSPQSLKILAQKWGVVVGKTLVEAFCIIRSIC